MVVKKETYREDELPQLIEDIIEKIDLARSNYLKSKDTLWIEYKNEMIALKKLRNMANSMLELYNKDKLTGKEEEIKDASGPVCINLGRFVDAILYESDIPEISDTELVNIVKAEEAYEVADTATLFKTIGYLGRNHAILKDKTKVSSLDKDK